MATTNPYGNKNLTKSAKDKEDEFYTQIGFIENELKHYKGHLKGKIIFCNCDDPEYSNFWKYFQLNFYELGLKKLISTHYDKEKPSYKMEIVATDDNNQIGIPDYVKTPLKENGDFRSPECVEILKEADIIITNPPFSLFRDYIAQLIEYGKEFLIVGNQNAITYNEIFPLIKDNKIWLGYNSGHFWFRVPDYYEEKKTDFKIDEFGNKWRRMGNICWLTNLDIEKRHENIILYKNYEPALYPKFDNYDCIEVSKTAEIPCDYYDIMAVPITFVDKYNPEQFEILGITDRQNSSGLRIKKYTAEDSPKFNDLNARGVIKIGSDYKSIYARILIRRKK